MTLSFNGKLWGELLSNIKNMEFIKKSGKIFEVQEKEIDEKALKEKQALLQGRINLLQEEINEITAILKS